MTSHNAIGIDFGTTSSRVAVFRNGKVDILAYKHGKLLSTPSCVAFTDTRRLIGGSAKDQAAGNPRNTVFDVKRLIGTNYSDLSSQTNLKTFPFKVVSGSGDRTLIQVEDQKIPKILTPEEIAAMILSKLKEIAENNLRSEVQNAVITVPTHFNYHQRQSVKDAAKIAGLNVLRLINEPTSAALTYGFEKKGAGEQNILIFNIGGGYMSASVLAIEGGIIQVKAHAGESFGGEDFDTRMVNHCCAEFKRKHEIDLSSNPSALRRLRDSCENAKRILSSSSEAVIEIEDLHEGIDFRSSISRARFEELCADLFQSTLDPVEKALRNANVGKGQIHDILLVGGSSRIPRVQRLLSDLLGKPPTLSFNSDDTAVHGAAVQAAILSEDKSIELEDLLILDVAPYSLGIETRGGVMDTLIKRNTTIPFKISKIFSTDSDNQTTFSTKIYEGDRAMTKDNRLLAEFMIHGIDRAPRGEPKIEVTFDIDADGVLEVSTIDKSTGIQERMIVNDIKRKSYVDELVGEAKKRKTDAKVENRSRRAKFELNKYVLRFKESLQDERLTGHLLSGDRKTIEEKFQEIETWLRENQIIGKDEVEQKKHELKVFANQILIGPFRSLLEDIFPQLTGHWQLTASPSERYVPVEQK